jgi:hypothetical protein
MSHLLGSVEVTGKDKIWRKMIQKSTGEIDA